MTISTTPSPTQAAAPKSKSAVVTKPTAAKTKTAKVAKSVASKPKAVAKTPKPSKAALPAKAAVVKPKPLAEEKAKKVKLVRDSFTMPKNEYLQIEELKMTLAKQGRPAKKSELLRAGLMLLSKQTPGALLACVQALATVKTGRPKKD